MNDGAGESRSNLVTPRAVIGAARGDPPRELGRAFAASLPVGGVDGTLQHRFRGDPRARSIRAKTGTLRHVSALSGYAGTRYAFALFATDYFGADRTAILQRA